MYWIFISKCSVQNFKREKEKWKEETTFSKEKEIKNRNEKLKFKKKTIKLFYHFSSKFVYGFSKRPDFQKKKKRMTHDYF